MGGQGIDELRGFLGEGACKSNGGITCAYILLELVWSWYEFGMNLVWSWYEIGMELVWNWCGIGVGAMGGAMSGAMGGAMGGAMEWCQCTTGNK